MAERANRPAAQTPDNPTPNPSGRDADGRFAAGNRGGPGNPFARYVAELRCAFIGAASPEDLQRVCQRMITMAALGDVAAAKLVLGYILGKVPPPVNPDTLDREECKLAAKNPTATDIAEIAQQRPAADLTVTFVRAQDILNSVRFNEIAQDLKDGKDPTAKLDADLDEEFADDVLDEECETDDEPPTVQETEAVNKRPQPARYSHPVRGANEPTREAHRQQTAPRRQPPLPNGPNGAPEPPSARR